MAVIVWRAFEHNTNATVDEVIVSNDIAFSTTNDHADVVVVDGVVEFGVSCVVNECIVGDLEVIKFVAVVVTVAHSTVECCKT